MILGTENLLHRFSGVVKRTYQDFVVFLMGAKNGIRSATKKIVVDLLKLTLESLPVSCGGLPRLRL